MKQELVMQRLFNLTALTALTAVFVAGTVHAEPVPPAERIAVDLRRTTYVVRDIDKSLPLYRDALGLKVIYDQRIGGGVDADGKARAPTLRLVLLRANDTFVGVLGLMQRLNITEAAPPPEFKKAGIGQSIMVFNVTDLDERWPRIANTPHIKVETPPTRVEYPSPTGGSIPVIFTAVWDADGNYVELNKLLGTAAGTVAPATGTASAASSASR
jgi:catechol 2,3-dioxygenase-like lactoylglutathione lyase family enzyme